MERALLDQYGAERHLHVDGLLSVHELGGGNEYHAHVIGRGEHFQHAAVDVQQRIDRLHRRSDRVFGREHAVAPGVGEFPNERKVRGAVV